MDDSDIHPTHRPPPPPPPPPPPSLERQNTLLTLFLDAGPSDLLRVLDGVVSDARSTVKYVWSLEEETPAASESVASLIF